MILKKFIGTKEFYKMLIMIALPIMVQSGITQFVNMLDNVMVGQVGTEQMSGVAIANQLIFVYSLCIFGGISGPGIFTAQFHGAGNAEGVRATFRFKILLCAALCLISVLILSVFDDELILLYLHDSSQYANLDLEATLNYGKEYLHILLIGLAPFAAMQVYTGTLRETGETLIPMKAAVVAVFVNLVFNYLLIFGKFGFPELGVRGAAIATVIARFIEAGIVIVYTHKNKIKNAFIVGAFKTLRVPRAIVGNIIKRGFPLMINEILWALGMTIITQCYSYRGLDAVAAYNISSTLSNLFGIVFMSIGSSVAIIVGNLLGAKKLEEARDADTKLIAASTMSSFVIGAIMAASSGLFPQLYNTTDEIRALAQKFIIIYACCMPLDSFTHACYFTLRSGGKTLLTFLFDSVYVWVCGIPVAYVLSRFTDLGIVYIVLIVNLMTLIKCTVGFFFVKSDFWLKNIVTHKEFSAQASDPEVSEAVNSEAVK